MSVTDPAALYCNPSVLMRMVQSGHDDALDRVTRCYGQRLLRAGQRYCRTHSEAEDAVQDALLIASEKLGDYRAEGSLEGFLVRIVANACRRLSRGARNDSALHDSQHELASSLPSPYAASCRSELARQLSDALLELDRNDRLILLLAEVEDWSGPEIAAELGLSHAAVRARLSRLRARLRRQLA